MILCSLILFMTGAQERAATRSRQEALLLEIRVEDVNREMPFFKTRRSTAELKMGPCARYSLPRRLNGFPENWAFLIRSEAEGAQYPNGWLFKPGLGEAAPPALDKTLNEIATAVDEEYLEFESNPSEVSAFWTEWGGPKQLKLVHEWLQSLGQA